MIKFACPQCQTTLKASDHRRGARSTCPQCGGVVQIPGPPMVGAGYTSFSAPPQSRPQPARRSQAGLLLLLGSVFAAGLLAGALITYTGLSLGGLLADHESFDRGRVGSAADITSSGNPPAPPTKEMATAKPPGSASKPSTSTSLKPPGTPDDFDRTALIDFVNRHAQKPANLEIVELGPRVPGNAGTYTRTIVLRCDLLDFTPDTVNSTESGKTGPTKVQPHALSRDSGTAYFTADGKVSRVYLTECQRWWAWKS